MTSCSIEKKLSSLGDDIPFFRRLSSKGSNNSFAPTSSDDISFFRRLSSKGSNNSVGPTASAQSTGNGLKKKVVTEEEWPVFRGRCMEITNEVERRRILVTDKMGVEVNIFDVDGQDLWCDRFPLTAFIPTSPLLSWMISEPSTKSLSVDEMRSKFAGVSQCTVLISNEEVWSCVLNTKLWEMGINVKADKGSTVVTDRSGVILDDLESSGHLPLPECFPLKIFHHSHPDKYAPRNSKTACAPSKPVCSTEMQFDKMLTTLVFAKLWQMGLAVDDECISTGNVLLTDVAGVDVSILGEVPHASRFPLKMHFVTRAFELRDEDDESFEGRRSWMNRQESGDKFGKNARALRRSASSLVSVLREMATPQKKSGASRLLS